MHTLETMSRLFFAEMRQELAASTRQSSYRYALEHLIDYLGKDTALQAITRADLIGWRDTLSNTYAISTANTYIRVAKRFLNWSIDYIEEETGDVRKNPAKKLKPVKSTATAEPRAISGDDAMRLMAAAWKDGNLRNQAIVLFLYATGGRVGGLVTLKMADLELKKSRAWVVEKGAKGRYVFLPDMLVEALSNYIRYQRPRIDGLDVVFVSQRRAPLTRQAVWYMLRNLAKSAGVDGIHNPHSFRHAFAIAYLQNGGDLSSLSRLLGHSTITITHQNYGRWADNELHAQHIRYNPTNGLTLPGGHDDALDEV